MPATTTAPQHLTERRLKKWGLFVAGAAAATLAQTVLKSPEYMTARYGQLLFRFAPVTGMVWNALHKRSLEHRDASGHVQDAFWHNLKANAYNNALYAVAPAAAVYALLDKEEAPLFSTAYHRRAS